MRRKLIHAVTILLLSALMTTNPFLIHGQGQSSVSGYADGAAANAVATVLGINADASVSPVAPVSLSSQGSSETNQVASALLGLGVPGVVTVLSTGILSTATSGFINATSAHSESVSTVNNVSILNGLVTASTIRSKSTSDGTGSSASSTAAGSFINQLRIAGILYEQSEFAPNTVVNVNASVQVLVNGLPVIVPVTGRVVLNEQTSEGNGTNRSSLTVTFLHVTVSGSVAGLITLNADVRVATAASGVNVITGPPTNRPPALQVPGPQSVQAGSILQFNVSASDPDSVDSVTLSVSNLPPNAGFTPSSGNPATGPFTFSPTVSQVGTFSITFTATDNHGSSSSGSVQITVTTGPPPANRPPVLSVPGPQIIEVGKTLTFQVMASDPDGDAVTLAAASVPPNASFFPASGLFHFTPSSQQVGVEYGVSFTATDSKGASAGATVQITVIAAGGGGSPGPPVISVPPSPIIIPVGTLLDFTVTATSPPPNCAVLLAAANLPANASFDGTAGRFGFTPAYSQADRSFVVTFTATDCTGQSATATVTINVIPAQKDGGGDTGPGRVCVPITKIFFDTAPVNGSCGFLLVSLINSGGGKLKINAMRLEDGRHFRVEGPANMPMSLQSAATLQLKIMFQPRETGTLLDTLTIVTDDPDHPTVTIVLKGKGKK